MDGPDSQTVLANDSVTFSCVAEGRPPPSVTWLQQSTDQTSAKVEKGDSVSIVTMQRGARETVSNLTLQSAQPHNAVEYTCNATNVAGNDTQSATLTVHGIAQMHTHDVVLCSLSSVFMQYYQVFCSWSPHHCSQSMSLTQPHSSALPLESRHLLSAGLWVQRS